MLNNDNTAIVSHFFDALAYLKAKKMIRGKATFCERYNVDRRNFYKLSKDYTLLRFQVAWIMYLHRDYNVSLDWLIYGKEPILQNENILQAVKAS